MDPHVLYAEFVAFPLLWQGMSLAVLGVTNTSLHPQHWPGFLCNTGHFSRLFNLL